MPGTEGTNTNRPRYDSAINKHFLGACLNRATLSVIQLIPVLVRDVKIAIGLSP